LFDDVFISFEIESFITFKKWKRSQLRRSVGDFQRKKFYFWRLDV